MTTTDTKTKIASANESWLIARQYVGLYGEFASSFSTTIRWCNNKNKQGIGEFSPNLLWQLRRLLRSDTVQAPLYYATKAFKKEAFESTEIHDIEDVAALYTPLELASVLAMLYLYRRTKKLSDPTEFELLEANLVARSEISTFVGINIPKIGFSIGLLTGIIRHIGLAAFLMHDKKGFAEYRRMLKIANKIIDLEYEFAHWGCSHIEIGTALLINIGFSREFARSFSCGLSATSPEEEEVLNNQSYAVRCADLWTNAYMSTGEPPRTTYRMGFYPSDQALAVLNEAVHKTTSSGGQFSWFKKCADDLTPEAAPELVNGKHSSTEDLAKQEQE
ncbi:MAG: hypothetical protein ACOX2O_02290 [Bdellovibrionota bacterium]|jgi:hypothetical protein